MQKTNITITETEKYTYDNLIKYDNLQVKLGIEICIIFDTSCY